MPDRLHRQEEIHQVSTFYLVRITNQQNSDFDCCFVRVDSHADYVLLDRLVIYIDN